MKIIRHLWTTKFESNLIILFVQCILFLKVNLNEYVGIINHTSHPHVMNDGTVYNMGMSITTKGPAYNIVCFSPSRLTIGN